MRYFSVFSGVGGFELALKDHECVGFSEINKYASQVLKYHFPNTPNYGDIKKIAWSNIPNFDLLVGGSPCQDFSIAGKQQGLTGERSGLFFEYVRALIEKQPAYFIWENVKGVISSSRGTDFTRIIDEFSEAGYSLWWQVLNAKDFGVPQNRERIFVVGSRNGSPREVFFERGADEEDSQPQDVMRQPLRYLNRNQKNIEGDYAFTVDASQTSGIRVKQPYFGKKAQTARTIRNGGKASKTDKHNWDTYQVEERIRRLTPSECERLMSWPDDHTRWGILDGKKVEMSDTQRYKMCGNGVVSAVVKEIMNHVLVDG